MMELVDVSDREKQAYQAGFQSGLAGECPNTVFPEFDDPALGRAWTKGWFDGDRSTDHGWIDLVTAEIRGGYRKTAREAAGPLLVLMEGGKAQI
jgi:ribosome modulation factor|tara:strand:+ start:407 stop:688 length:282 start_codon:yes stop_codon:yes gene_type:complete